METISVQNIEGVVKGLIRKYYSERMDNVVIAFGTAGDKVLRNIRPLQIRRTVYRSVQLKKERAVSPTVQAQDAEIILAEPEPVKVSIISREEYEYRKNIDQFDCWQEAATVNTTFIEGSGDAEATARELLCEVEKSNSYILISGFGGDFAQDLHMAFSLLLKERNIPHLNVIIKPSREDLKRRKTAESGIKKLEAACGKPRIYDNERLIEKNKEYAREKDGVIRKINVRIARDVEVYSTRLSNASELLKYQLSA
jgi:cell division GTPase FtsZ